MPPKPDSPIEPFKRAIAATTRVTGLALSIWGTSSSVASACTTVRPDVENVTFQNWVAKADRITLARVVNMAKLPTQPSWNDDTVTVYKRPYKFTLATVEQIKGNTLATFTVNGFNYSKAPSQAELEQVESQHFGVGLFWTWFSGSCHYRPGFVPGTQVLIFQDAAGNPLGLYDRNPELIVRPDDPWLLTVKALARNSSDARPRTANLLEFIRAASAIFVTETTKCALDGSGRGIVSERRILRQVWGQTKTVAELEKDYIWDEWEPCDLGYRQLLIVQSQGFENQGLRLRIDDQSNSIDFAGFLEGTDQGLIPDLRARWASQISFSGQRIWKLSELESVLRNIETKPNIRN